jgi:hypothetical protein
MEVWLHPFLKSPLMTMNCQLPASATSPVDKEPRVPHEIIGSGEEKNPFHLLGFKPRIVQSIAYLLYQL